MTKKIFRSIFIVALTVLLSCLALIMGVLFTYFRGVQKDQLKSELNLAAAAVEMGNKNYLENVNMDGGRLTWVDADGVVLFDSASDASTMENHKDREEIKEAIQTGTGESSRFSATLTEETLYYAKRLSDGTVLRISVGLATVPALLFGILQPILIVFILALILSIVLSNRLSKKIVSPLNEIDLDRPLENDTYDEISPLLTRIEKQRKKINAQQKELEDKKNEFYAVIKNMNEGLVLLNKDGIVLSINPAASQFFNVDDAVGKDLIETERNPEIGKAVKYAAENGSRSLEISRNGREYQLNINSIQSENEVSGIVMLIFDVTEKVFAERNRKEFTANVSHELKTPLQSIMGSAELLENGLVKKQDIPRFVGHIRTEASRLLNLIEDIIRLSRLDEHAEPESEEVDLFALASEEVKSLQQQATAKNVTLSVEGEKTVITGVRQLLHETIYNLCDNAIKYNVEGGSVKVKVSSAPDSAVLSVADTGIGIPAEHHDRIFERFYRVDKSRSKETGGTGLGLSIVKHAVQYMGGTIKVKSAPSKGTEITVTFKK